MITIILRNLKKKYNPIWHDAQDFLTKSENSIIMLLSIDEPFDTTTKVIYEHLSRNIDNKNNTFLINDYFVKDQLLFIPPEWSYIYETNEEVILSQIEMDSYPSFLFNYIRKK